ncbi:MAG: hypothetical protein K6F31_01160 [Acetatifactor sp.]|nr:hypothetical protein [Acetatifactor sp.]
MTSQKSTNKSSICLLSLMREDIRHKNWMLVLSVLGSFLAGPVATLFFLSMYSYRERSYLIVGDGIYSLDRTFIMTLSEFYSLRLDIAKEFLSGHLFILMLVIAFIGAMIVAFLGFRYLYHRQMVDLYHGIPVSRKKLFLSGWLSGLLIWLVPAAISSLLVALILIIYLKGMFFAAILAQTLLVLLRLTLCYLIVYNVCLVGVMLSGNALNALVSGLSYGLIVFMIVCSYFVLAESFYDTFYLRDTLLYTNPLYVFSPLTTPIVLACQWLAQGAYATYHVWHLCGGILICALNFFLAGYLYLKRPSELSERGLENKPVRIVLRAGISLIGGLFFAMVCYVGADHMFPWMVFGTVLGSALTFCVLNVIFHCTFKKVISHKLQYVITLALSIAFISIIMFDLTGYDKRIPNEKNIKGISIFCGAMYGDDWDYEIQDGNLVRAGHEEPLDFIACDDPAKIHDLLSACILDTQGSWHYNLHTNRIVVKVKTTFGSYYRAYQLSAQNDVKFLAPMVETEEYAKNYYPLKSLMFGNPTTIRLSGSLTTDEFIEDEARIDELMQALHQDFEEHRTVYDLLRESRKFQLDFYYPRGDMTTRNAFSCDIPYWYEHTISLVEKWYPKKKFDPVMSEISKFTVDASFDFEKGENLHDALYRYFGYDPQGNPLPSPAENRNALEPSLGGYAYWSFDLSEENLQLLAALEPYLIWGQYSDPLYNEYMELGVAEDEEGRRAECSIRYGKLPLEILQRMEQLGEIYVYEDDNGDVAYDTGSFSSYMEKYSIE